MGWRGKDILLREDTLDDTRAALDRLKEARADWYRVDVGRLVTTRKVLDVERELNRKVPYAFLPFLSEYYLVSRKQDGVDHFFCYHLRLSVSSSTKPYGRSGSSLSNIST